MSMAWSNRSRSVVKPLQQIQAAKGERENGDLGACGHRVEVVLNLMLRGDNILHVLRSEGRRVERVDQQHAHGPIGGHGLRAGVGAGGEFCGEDDGASDAGLLEGADGLRFAVLLDGEVGVL